MSIQNQRTFAFVNIVVVVLLLLAPVARAKDPELPFSHPLPDGFSMYMALMGTGLYDWNSPHPEIPNCFQQLCVGNYFFDEILGWDAAEQADYYQKARDFWTQRFGIDPEDPAWVGRVMAIPIMADPRINIRAYSMAGARVHEGGWEVLDGAWLLIVTDPDGVELGGEYAGTHVGPNTTFGHGKYIVLARDQNGRHLADIVIDYQARGPIAFVQGFPFVGNCEVTATTIDGEPTGWGSGHGQPSQVSLPQPSGEVKISYRNILTFGAGSGFGEPIP